MYIYIYIYMYNSNFRLLLANATLATCLMPSEHLIKSNCLQQ